ncbi:hypothetical protein niasHT_029911 [Heterodera trifolii]|uniref:Protein kinase domain-containing protein n=1 Tax=Heterodera trifolii TaxID=157864 RepID=A0ABD2KBB4_9BILA
MRAFKGDGIAVINPKNVATTVPQRAHNICGVLNKAFTIVAPADDPMERDFGIYELFNANDPQTKYIALIMRPEAQKKSAYKAFWAFYELLKSADGDVHLPYLVASGSIKKFFFGMDNIQQIERGTGWRRPAMILKLHSQCVFLVAIRTLSPTGIDNIANKIIVMDLTLAKQWEPEKTNDASVRFSGTLKYSSLRALNGQTVGSADDLISIIFIVAELISGKIPWRSVSKIEKCIALRQKFTESIEFRRLPREMRRLYNDLCNTSAAERPQFEEVMGAFETALKRRAGSEWFKKEVPDWLEMPSE